MKNPEKINEEMKRNLEANGKGGITFHSQFSTRPMNSESQQLRTQKK
jgi:hypothetical protein